jgi:hypothetical protein
MVASDAVGPLPVIAGMTSPGSDTPPDTPPDTPLPANPAWLRPLDVRRAILGTYLRAGGGPLSIHDVVHLLLAEGLDLAATQRTSAPQRVSDVMRHQVRVGRAQVVARGVFELDVRAFSESSRYRCLHWYDVGARWHRRYR